MRTKALQKPALGIEFTNSRARLTTFDVLKRQVVRQTTMGEGVSPIPWPTTCVPYAGVPMILKAG